MPEFWAAAFAHALPGDQAALGDTAHPRGLYQAAAKLLPRLKNTGAIQLHAPDVIQAAWPKLEKILKKRRSIRT